MITNYWLRDKLVILLWRFNDDDHLIVCKFMRILVDPSIAFADDERIYILTHKYSR